VNTFAIIEKAFININHPKISFYIYTSSNFWNHLS